MKLSRLKQIIEETLKEQHVKGMPSSGGMQRNQLGGGTIQCVCADGRTCNSNWKMPPGAWDCECCLECPESQINRPGKGMGTGRRGIKPPIKKPRKNFPGTPGGVNPFGPQ